VSFILSVYQTQDSFAPGCHMSKIKSIKSCMEQNPRFFFCLSVRIRLNGIVELERII